MHSQTTGEQAASAAAAALHANLAFAVSVAAADLRLHFYCLAMYDHPT
jgi:hypothetical protein